MNEKELIRSEILKMKDQTGIGLSEYDCGHENGANEMCDKILAFIDTLPGEPLSDDMEVEFGSYLQRVFKVRKEGNVYKTNGLKISPYDLMNLACYFARWQYEYMMKKAVVLHDELSMCYLNGKPTGLSPYEEWWNNEEVLSRFKDGDKVLIMVFKEEQ
jgi:hypothetical protein